MVNFYNEKYINAIRVYLHNQGYDKDIPIDYFKTALVVTFGLKDFRSANRWLTNYVHANIVTCIKQDKDNWIVNFKSNEGY